MTNRPIMAILGDITDEAKHSDDQLRAKIDSLKNQSYTCFMAEDYPDDCTYLRLTVEGARIFVVKSKTFHACPFHSDLAGSTDEQARVERVQNVIGAIQAELAAREETRRMNVQKESAFRLYIQRFLAKRDGVSVEEVTDEHVNARIKNMTAEMVEKTKAMLADPKSRSAVQTGNRPQNRQLVNSPRLAVRV